MNYCKSFEGFDLLSFSAQRPGEIASGASGHPDIICYLFFGRRAQVEVDTRLLSTHFYIDREFHRAARDNAESIVAGLAALFSGFPLLLHHGRSHLHICRAPRHRNARRRNSTRSYWLASCRDWFVLVFTWDCDRDLHPDCRFAHWRNTPVTGSHSPWPALNASSFRSEQFLACLRLSSFHANR
jgi:hypothetical protein